MAIADRDPCRLKCSGCGKEGCELVSYHNRIRELNDSMTWLSKRRKELQQELDALSKDFGELANEKRSIERKMVKVKIIPEGMRKKDIKPPEEIMKDLKRQLSPSELASLLESLKGE